MDAQATLEAIHTKEYLTEQRSALLHWLDALERLLGIEPRTAELRKEYNKRIKA